MKATVMQREKMVASGPLGSRRDVLVGGAMMLAAGAAFVKTPRHALNYLGNRKLEDLVPKKFDGWQFETTSGLVLPPKDQLVEQTYSQLLTRTYSRNDQRVMLLVAYSGKQTGMVQVHRPEVCYPASGYHLDENEQHDVFINSHVKIPSRYIVASAQAASEQLVYWTRIGPYYPSRWAEQRMAVAKSNLHGDIPDGILVRVSTNETGDTRPLLDGFIQSLYAHGDDTLRLVLFGVK